MQYAQILRLKNQLTCKKLCLQEIPTGAEDEVFEILLSDDDDDESNSATSSQKDDCDNDDNDEGSCALLIDTEEKNSSAKPNIRKELTVSIQFICSFVLY